ncbi:MAG TPA: M23 family metallopeptidase [Acidimicrobiales bacterium]|nr:M23 family metallopeptidase [Acidimicrobiales bacterium]
MPQQRKKIRKVLTLLVLVLGLVAVQPANPAVAHQDYSAAPNGYSPWYYQESYQISGNWYNEGTHKDYVNGVHYNDYHAIDFGMPCGRRLYAMYDGMTVKYANHNDGTLEMHKNIGGRTFSVMYRHMDQINVGVGASVGSNTMVGYSGTKGYSTGCHLHLSVRVLGPDGKWYSIQPQFCGRTYPHDHRTYFRGC